ncbi:WW domain-containing oxidoreductase OS=Danio rerio GN=wwox PE=2 SV=1 [Rhizoctonia solani AG-1 IB]|uniref:WW domain-containing oxidoreductase n=1 Tax=Thanatephorus cucumeris (strain AG1-IB / isolate 7/3/14) TaxID=1108050 RepID=A0A0B7FFK2_THACB|nr:WW domain-containing oxidoreductase OS=Danio rerio GN=wwox PE=2 SV=1 [Rhizoctonia solani AG-1 IB]
MLSFTRIQLDNFLVSFYPDMTMPVADLSGKLAIVTGANSGIGLEAARALARMNAHVVLACRNKSRAEEAKRQIIGSTGNLKVEVEMLDCGSFASVRAFLSRWNERQTKKVDILINNAGGLAGTISLTEDGYEQTYQSNHLAHVLLTHSLLNSGWIATNGRIVSVSSAGFYGSDPLDKQNAGSRDILAKLNNQVGSKLSFSDMMQLYFRSKASQAVWSMALQRRLAERDTWRGITVSSYHPGTVKSSIWTQPDGAGSMVDMISSLMKFGARTLGITNEQGAITAVWLAVAPEPASPELNGRFWDRKQWKWVNPWSLGVERQDELWDLWCRETGTSLN